MKPDKRYIVEKVPLNRLAGGTQGPVWYCHLAGFSYVPVFGSIGERERAVEMCRCMNPDGRVYFS